MDRDERRDPRVFLRGLENIVMTYPFGGWIFRGEPACYPEISSGLYRAYRDQTDDFVRLEQNVVGEARRFSGLTEDSQVVADVQHRGGKTNQIDFTEDLGIAAYFACQVDSEHREQDGRIIMLAARELTGRGLPWEPQIKRSLRTPTGLAGMQRSVLVAFPMGHVPAQANGHTVIITIPAADKRNLLDYLRFCRGIEAGTVFSDTMGYVRNQDDYIHYDVWLGKARGSYGQGDYPGAITAVDRYLDRRFPILRDDDGIKEAYRIRGLCLYRLGRKIEAFRDWVNRDLDLPGDLGVELAEWAVAEGHYRKSSDGAVHTSVFYGGLTDRHRAFELSYTKRCRMHVLSGQEPEGLVIRIVTDRGDWNTSAGVERFDGFVGQVGGDYAWLSVWGGGVEYITTGFPLEAGVRAIVVRHRTGNTILEVEIVDEDGTIGH